jgi:redox-sensitive bicupin YhaK (pirin superfamily)
MAKDRKIRKLVQSLPTLEGAGVHLRRAFGFREVPEFDPFLLLDDFRGDDPQYYIKGFPWHPHRGIETITYMLEGTVEHGDSIGNEGVINPGDVQWMTAGSGILHQEMPKGNSEGRMGGFQLWANLPASHKMMEPRYRDITSDQIPEVEMPNGVKVRVICGEVGDVQGAARDIVIEPEYLDVSIPKNSEYIHVTKPGNNVFAYVIDGEGLFSDEKKIASNHNLLLFDDGDQITITTEDEPVRFLLASGRPLNEPVAWRGPIVMNTQEELETAFREYREGTFIKNRP